jgi:hypothetical protein
VAYSVAKRVSNPWKLPPMETLFWTAFSFMSVLVLARIAVPVVAPTSRLSAFLIAHVSLWRDEPEDLGDPSLRGFED